MMECRRVQQSIKSQYFIVSDLIKKNVSGKQGIVVSTAPVVTTALFSTDITSGTVPLTVKFTDVSTSTAPLSYSWNFGDGTTSTEQNPAYTYTNAGRYTVKLTVTNAGGSNTMTKGNYITVKAPPAPVATFIGAPTSGKGPLAVQFTDASTGVVTSYKWDFGDGTSSTQQSPSHTYIAARSYTVKLTVSNTVGSNTMTKKNYIIVK
jgi:large repetitive protein